MGYDDYQGNRVGKLNGMPVYKVSVSQWNLSDTSAHECFYWVGDLLFYHDVKVGTVKNGGNVDLDDAKVSELKQKWSYSTYEAPARMEKPAETRPVEEPKPDNDPAEPARPHDELVSSMLNRAAWTIKDMLKGCNMAADAFLETVKEA